MLWMKFDAQGAIESICSEPLPDHEAYVAHSAIAALPTQSAAPMQCAECDCDNPPHGCNWIKAGPSLADALELPEIKAMVEAAFCEGYYMGKDGAWDSYSRAWPHSDAFTTLQNNKTE
jgi:hypothetical protein